MMMDRPIFSGGVKSFEAQCRLDQARSETITIPTQWGGYSEGPFMIKRKGIYYYFYTMGGYADYQNAYVMSKESPLGPFLTAGKDVIISSDLDKQIWGPGHGFAFSPKGTDDWYFVYLEYVSEELRGRCIATRWNLTKMVSSKDSARPQRCWCVGESEGRAADGFVEGSSNSFVD